jgi:hypothetical protein
MNVDDLMPKKICISCQCTIREFDTLYHTAIQSSVRLQKIIENNQEKNRREEDTEEESLVEALQIDGDNLRLNFAATQDDGSDKSLEIPPSIETDLAKDIDRILAMTAQLDDITGDPSQIYTCDFCQQNNLPQPPLATQNELNEHLKSLHCDSCFHCDSCSNMIDRNSLIEHMMQHLKEAQVYKKIL